MRTAPLLASAAAFLLSALPLPAQDHSAHAELHDREIKALSAEEVTGYLAGEGLGFAIAAELNGYPGPAHALDLAEALELTEDQLRQIRTIRSEMLSEAVWLGEGLVARERELDAAFADRAADAETVERLTADIGRLRGRIRNVHLRAHLRTTELLTQHQIHRYAELRGYADGQGGRHDHP